MPYENTTKKSLSLTKELLYCGSLLTVLLDHHCCALLYFGLLLNKRLIPVHHLNINHHYSDQVPSVIISKNSMVLDIEGEVLVLIMPNPKERTIRNQTNEHHCILYVCKYPNFLVTMPILQVVHYELLSDKTY